MGRLYSVDMRLRPTGKSGSLAIPLAGFRAYYGLDSSNSSGGCAQLWERQVLTRARVVHGDQDFGALVLSAVAEAMHPPAWGPAVIQEILSMRHRLEGSRGKRDLKRGPGGMMDVEFLVEMFQLKYGRAQPQLLQSNLWQALAALESAKLLNSEEYAALKAGYDFLLSVQSRLRIVHNRTLDELPESPAECDKLARRLGERLAGASVDQETRRPGDKETEGEASVSLSPGLLVSRSTKEGACLLAQLDQHTRQIRQIFLRLLDRESNGRDQVSREG